jgi:hypothetical protein
MKFNELSQELQELWTRGVDHSNFNEDWATVGGVVEIDYQKYSGAWNLYPVLEVLAKAQFYCGHWQYVPFGEDETFGEVIMDDHNVLSKRMATPSECADAGIDYVPFMGWRDIESAPTDTHVLLKHESQGAVIGTRNPRFEDGTPCFFSEQVKTGYRQDVKNFDALAWMPLPLV